MTADLSPRTFKVLVALVLSMAGGSVILTLAEPRPARPPDAAHQPALLTAPLLTASRPLKRWDAVRITHDLGSTLARGHLRAAALRGELPCHFLVLPDGSVLTTRLWRDQLPPPDRSAAVVVRWVADPHEPLVSRRQWNALCDLLDVLSRHLGIDPAAIRLAPDLHRPDDRTPAQARHLRALLLRTFAGTDPADPLDPLAGL